MDSAQREKERQVIDAQAQAEQTFVAEQRRADAEAYAHRIQAEAQQLAADAEAAAIRKRAEAESDAEKLRAEGARAAAMVPVEVRRAEIDVDAKMNESFLKGQQAARVLGGFFEVADDTTRALLDDVGNGVRSLADALNERTTTSGAERRAATKPEELEGR